MKPSNIKEKAKKILSANWGKGAAIIMITIMIEVMIAYINSLCDTAYYGSKIIMFILAVVDVLINVPIAYGVTISFVKMSRGEDIEVTDFILFAFDNFSRAWNIAIMTIVNMFVPICVLAFGIVAYVALSAVLVSGVSGLTTWTVLLGVIVFLATLTYAVVVGLLYAMAVYIGYDHPEYTATRAVAESAKMMKGKRSYLFLLDFSFIGWYIIFALPLVALVCKYVPIVIEKAKDITVTVNMPRLVSFGILSAAFFVIGYVITTVYLYISHVVFYDELRKKK